MDKYGWHAGSKACSNHFIFNQYCHYWNIRNQQWIYRCSYQKLISYAWCLMTKDINNLVVIGRWWWQNLILNHVWFIQKQFLLFLSRFGAIGCTVSKNTDKIKINFCKINMAIKTQYLMLILTIHQKSWKIHAKTVIEKRNFYLFFLGQRFLAKIIFGDPFCIFFEIKNQHQFFRFMIPIKNFCKKKFCSYYHF